MSAALAPARASQACVAIVGAGPAGLRAAEALVAAGLRPVLIDEAPRVGGQVYRQPPPALARPVPALYGAQAARAQALFERWATIAPQVDHRPGTLVWHIEGGRLHLLEGERPSVLAPDALLLATGATDRVLPFPGWTLPGVFTLGGAQTLLKAQAARIGPRVVCAGSGPLLLLVAAQLRAAGADVRAVLDTAPPGARWRAVPGLAARPRMAWAGLQLLLQLRIAGVPVHQGARLVRAEGDARVERLVWRDAHRGEQTIDTDAIAFGYGLRSETQLAALAGCAFAFDALDDAWLPRTDGAGRSSVRGVYLAGDGHAIRGADAAEEAGARAAAAMLADLRAAGRALLSSVPGAPAAGPAHASAAGNVHATAPAPAPAPASATEPAPAPAANTAHERWRHAMHALSKPPADWAASAPDELIVCRCEHVSAAALRGCVRDTGTRELNRLKALTRIGMGRCQGRMCGAAAARLLAHATAQPLADVGHLRMQPPVKPVPVAALAQLTLRAPPDGHAPPHASEVDDD